MNNYWNQMDKSHSGTINYYYQQLLQHKLILPEFKNNSTAIAIFFKRFLFPKMI